MKVYRLRITPNCESRYKWVARTRWLLAAFYVHVAFYCLDAAWCIADDVEMECVREEVPE